MQKLTKVLDAVEDALPSSAYVASAILLAGVTAV
jgi:hypothetical protein